MGTDLIVNIGRYIFTGLAVLTAGVMIYSVANDYQIEVETPFFGKWKLSKKSMT